MKSRVMLLANKIVKQLIPYCKKIQTAGSIRRKEKNPRDIDIVLIPKDRLKLEDCMEKLGSKVQGGEKESIWKVQGVKVELYYTTGENWGATLLAYSSRKGAGIGLRIIARLNGFKLNQYGLWRKGEMVAGRTEEEIYKALGREYKKPENR
ncbi:MAG: hypothetical protein KKA64_01845 [Nanoarchaeota archaeon]|nr:hypothetical protein [Nanoarchaeota archaeon]